MAKRERGAATAPERPAIPGQVVLTFQGGGALGAYQLGVYEALHEAGIEPDWVVGTSIGAINGALIAGNAPEHRLERLHQFWALVAKGGVAQFGGDASGAWLANLMTVCRGVPGFFAPNMAALFGQHARLGVEQAAYYTTEPLRATLEELIDFDHLRDTGTRLTVGAVNARTGAMRYFDSRSDALAVEHVMASGALPPAFPAVRIDGEPYWDGGIYSNTPIEAVLDDRPRRDSLIFSVQLWNPEGPEPETLWQVAGRQKDIQFASRADSHIERQQQLHRLRHIIRELEQSLPPELQRDPMIKELTAWGCGTTMHLIRLNAPRLESEDHTKDIDFSAGGIEARRAAGYADTRRVLADAPWRDAGAPHEGVVIHALS